MCLLAVAVAAHPDLPFVVAANRDEFFRRPSARAAWWDDAPQVFAGRDLEQGGTWLGVTRSGRFAALTNYRDPSDVKSDAPSRGGLVSGFLRGRESPPDYLGRLRDEAAAYNGFNLLVGEAGRVWCLESRALRVRELPPGIHGLSNALLDTPWPKVVRLKARLAQSLASTDRPDVTALMDDLADRAISPDPALPSTGVPHELERALSATFIRLPHYGTRCSTLVTLDRRGRLDFVERTFDANGPVPPDVSTAFTVERA